MLAKERNLQKQVLIVGGGIAGLVLAVRLKQLGLQPLVIEKSERWTIKGSGMHLYSNAIRALDSIGVADEICDTVFCQDDYIYADPKDLHRVQVRYPRLAGEKFPGLASLSRQMLHDILIRAVEKLEIPVRMGTTFVSASEQGDALTVTFSDGREEKFALMIGCDGINSQVRNQIFGELEPFYTGQAIWRALLPRHPDSKMPKIMYAGAGKMFGIIPVSENQIYLLAGMPDPDKPKYPEEKFVQLIKENFAEFGGLAPHYLGLITKPEQVGYTAIEMVNQPPPWHKGRVFLIGDAAHASPPYLAQGAAMAIEDSIVLGELIAADLPLNELQSQFMQRRFERASYIQNLSLQRNKERYQGKSYSSSDTEKSERIVELEQNAQRQINELYAELANPI